MEAPPREGPCKQKRAHIVQMLYKRLDGLSNDSAHPLLLHLEGRAPLNMSHPHQKPYRDSSMKYRALQFFRIQGMRRDGHNARVRHQSDQTYLEKRQAPPQEF